MDPMTASNFNALRGWLDRNMVVRAAMRAAAARFREATTSGDEVRILAARNALAVASVDARSFALADPCPDQIWHERILDMIDVWAEVVELLQTVAVNPDAFADGGEAQLEELRVRIDTREQMIDERRVEIFGSRKHRPL
jgi:hypothetical protein